MNDISVCDGINCRLKHECVRYREYLKYNDDISLLYLSLIKGINGEFYPCKPDIFEKTYEIIND